MDHPQFEFSFLGFTADCVGILNRAVSLGFCCTSIYTDADEVVPTTYRSAICQITQWPELLAADASTIIFIALDLDDDTREDIVRSLVSQGLSIVIVDPNANSLFAYELEMIRTETDATLMALCYTDLPHNVAGTSVQQITILGAAKVRKIKQVTEELTRDLLQLSTLAGEAKYLYALAPGTLVPIVSTADLDISLTLEMRNGLIVQWSNNDTTQATTEYVLSNDQRILPPRSFNGDSLETQLLAIFSKNNSGASPTWLEYAKARETAEMIPLSLKKGRQIELFDTHPTETDAFKGVMSGAGCFLLLFTLAVIGLFAGYDTMRLSDLRDLHQTALSTSTTVHARQSSLLFRLWPVYPFLLFLGFQFMRSVIKKSKRTKQA
jgi:hypothetical protein